MKRFVFVLALFSCVGCAAPLYVTYHSDPEGATLYLYADADANGEQLVGYTPLRLQYPAMKGFKDDVCANLQPVGVRWASGAFASARSIRACASKGRNQQIVFHRPVEVPGADIDAQFASQLQRNAALAQQGQAGAATSTIQMPAATHCTSSVIGNQVFTNCY